MRAAVLARSELPVSHLSERQALAAALPRPRVELPLQSEAGLADAVSSESPEALRRTPGAAARAGPELKMSAWPSESEPPAVVELPLAWAVVLLEAWLWVHSVLPQPVSSQWREVQPPDVLVPQAPVAWPG